MKKVRFESPVKVFYKRMDEWDCHSPRPYIERQEPSRPDIAHSSRLLTYDPDPVQRFENSNSSPYPIVIKTSVPSSESKWDPSNDLDLSILDCSFHEPRKSLIGKQQLYLQNAETLCNYSNKLNDNKLYVNSRPHVLSSIENKVNTVQNNGVDNNFFIRRENFDQFHTENLNALKDQLNKLSLSKENVSAIRTGENAGLDSEHLLHESRNDPLAMSTNHISDENSCCHCSKVIQNASWNLSKNINKTIKNYNGQHIPTTPKHCICKYQPQHICNCGNCIPIYCRSKESECNRELNKSKENSRQNPQNAVDKRNWMLQRYPQSKEVCFMEVDQQRNVVKEKREPTVADLFKIIKLQNEQLQLLQEKVDKFISVNSNKNINPPIQNFVTEQLAFESVDSEQHKISIGVMTSFEMVRTSTVINKEYVTQNSDNTQIHCNKSQISIKEVISKTQPVNLNFLDGIRPVDKSASVQTDNCTEVDNHSSNRDISCGVESCHENIDDKTLNELSLYNVQVDNATTPLISPEQSLCLDVRDYSDSESGGDDQSNVGWTYYNKVMTHVNGMLQDSDMPSSASALYRNTRQQCVQMQFDKTNVSVTKRVKFGDDPLGLRQPHIYAASTDTSLKMNQLAAKYLNRGPTPTQNIVAPSKPAVPMEMSFATRNYMEQHRILQGGPMGPGEMPRFLDITALKQQPKLL